MLTKEIVRKIQEEFEKDEDSSFLCTASLTFAKFWSIDYERDAIRLLASRLKNQGLLGYVVLSINERVLFSTHYGNDQDWRNDRKLFLEELLKSNLIP